MEVTGRRCRSYRVECKVGSHGRLSLNTIAVNYDVAKAARSSQTPGFTRERRHEEACVRSWDDDGPRAGDLLVAGRECVCNGIRLEQQTLCAFGSLAWMKRSALPLVLGV